MNGGVMYTTGLGSGPCDKAPPRQPHAVRVLPDRRPPSTGASTRWRHTLQPQSACSCAPQLLACTTADAPPASPQGKMAAQVHRTSRAPAPARPPPHLPCCVGVTLHRRAHSGHWWMARSYSNEQPNTHHGTSSRQSEIWPGGTKQSCCSRGSSSSACRHHQQQQHHRCTPQHGIERAP